ncbi:MAG: hypothetical protein LBG69_08020 [Zoogloeaceae bacterium]|jgi:hypothetical protein|nr:hypothetical protein [Zoogloeaceae bacterium]
MKYLEKTPRRPRAERGFTMLEFTLFVIIMILLIGGYARVTRYYQEQMEEVAVKLTLSHMRVGMALDWASRISKGENKAGVSALIGSNPVAWLDEPPVNYLGEIKTPKLERYEEGRWLFDVGRKELVYIVKNSDHLILKNSFDEVRVLRWQVRLSKSKQNKNQTPEFGDLEIAPVYEYKWFGQ